MNRAEGHGLFKHLLTTLGGTRPSRLRAAALVRAGNLANRERRWREAAEAYAAALALRPDRPGVLVQYGHALKEQGFLTEATSAYLRAARLEPGNADTHLQIGHVMRLQAENERAAAAYEAAHRLDPAMVSGHDELAELRRACPEATIPANLHLQPRPLPMQESGANSVADALQAAGLNDGFLPLFDAFYYHQANPVVRAALPSPERTACLLHFCRVGLELVLPFAPEAAFDAEFYRENYLHGMAFTPANAYRHWLTTGLPQGAVQSRVAWIRTHLGSGLTSLDGIDLALFAAQQDPAAIGAGWVLQAERFLQEAGDPELSIEIGDQTAEIFHALATRLEQGGGDQASRAFRLRQMIAQAVPAHAENRQKLADALFHRGNFAESARLYRSLQPDSASPGSMLGTAVCEERLGQPGMALQTLAEACVLFPESEGLRRERLAQAERLFGRVWNLAMANARLGRIADGQAEVERACDAIVGALQPVSAGSTRTVPPRAIRRVALAGHAPLPQCRFYRIDQTAELLRSTGFEVVVFDLASGTAEFHAALHGLDAVVFCRVPALPRVIAAIEAARCYGLVTFYDMDDLIFDPAYPDPLESYGGLVSRDEHAGLALAVPLFDRAMRMCLHGIASTEALATAMRTRVTSGHVFVRPNAMGAVHSAFVAALQACPAAPGGLVTLFYGSGGKAHKADFAALMEPALVALVSKYGARIHIVLVGEFPETAALQSIAGNLTLLPATWDLDSYWSVLAQADINLAVLLPGPATDAKSEIKWLEAAMLGIPSVVSDTATYRAVVQPNETGIVCAAAADWTRALDRLAGDATLRHRIGTQARRQALEQYAPGPVAARLRDAIHAVSAPEDARPLVVLAHVFYPPQAVGGATRVVRDNVRDLLSAPAAPFQIEVFACLDGGTPYAVSSDAQDGVRVTRTGSPDRPDLEHWATDERMGMIFGAYLDAVRPAMVHFHCIQRLTASIVTAAAARGIPYIVTVHDGWWISEHQFLLDRDGQVQTYDMARPVETLRTQGAAAHARLAPLRQALLQARHVVAVSEPFAAVYRACGLANVIAVENGCPPLPPPARVASPDAKVRLGFIGGLARHKGYDLVRIAAAARPFRNLALLLIDHGLPAGSLRQERWGSVDVEIRGKWPQDDVSALYGRIDVLLAPSLWPESFGLVTREAAASGCFVIASDRGSIGSFLREGVDGFVIDVSSPDGLVGALERLEADPTRFLRPVENRARQRPAAAQAEELAALYATLLAERPSPAFERSAT